MHSRNNIPRRMKAGNQPTITTRLVFDFSLADPEPRGLPEPLSIRPPPRASARQLRRRAPVSRGRVCRPRRLGPAPQAQPRGRRAAYRRRRLPRGRPHWPPPWRHGGSWLPRRSSSTADRNGGPAAQLSANPQSRIGELEFELRSSRLSALRERSLLAARRFVRARRRTTMRGSLSLRLPRATLPRNSDEAPTAS